MLPRLWLCCEGGRKNEISENLFYKAVNRLPAPWYLAAGLIFFTFRFDGTLQAQTQPPAYSAEAAANYPRPDEGRLEARIQILTRPIAAIVWLDGEYGMTGRTPYTITHFLRGRYRIRATKPGYEDWEKDYVFNGQGDDKLTIKLAKKTRFKALWKSMYLPGSGQIYSDHRTQGAVIGLMQFSAAGVLLYQQIKYNNALNDYNTALKNFQASQRTQDGQADLIAQVVARKAVLDDAYEIRKNWLVVTGVIYAYNLLDAVIFFPSYHHGDAEVRVSLDQNLGGVHPVIGLNVKATF
jgi:hypothetical protein